MKRGKKKKEKKKEREREKRKEKESKNNGLTTNSVKSKETSCARHLSGCSGSHETRAK